MSRLALLIPARNAERHLDRLFDSVDAQSSPFDEILLYDDESGDRTGEIAARRGARVIRSDVNTGPSAGKNLLTRLTACDWVHFHDADDALHPEFVRSARGWIARDAADVVLFATDDRDDRTGRPLGEREWDAAALASDPVRFAIVQTITNCGLYRRVALARVGGFDVDPSVAYNEDQALHLRLALAGLRFAADPLRGVVLYQRAASMSSGHRIECARAACAVMAIAARETGTRYAAEIGARVWQLAAQSAGYSDWENVARCLDVAAAVGYRYPHAEHWAVRLLSLASPTMAIRTREGLIRAFKPHLRRDMPRVQTQAAAESSQARTA